METTKTTKTTKEKDISFVVIGCAIEVHRLLGPGLLESTYHQCLAHELAMREVPFKLQAPIPLQYKGVRLDCGFRIDMVIENQLIVEIKSTEQLIKLHHAQLLTYMKLTNVRTGLLINFNAVPLKNGIKRFVL